MAERNTSEEDSAFAEYLRRIADIVEEGKYYKFEFNQTGLYSPSMLNLGQGYSNVIGKRMSFELEVRNDG